MTACAVPDTGFLVVNGYDEISSDDNVAELAYATAEHHPYWNLLYNCSEITSTVLEKWKESLTAEDFSDIDWAIKELNQSLEKIKNKKSSNS